MGDRIDPDAVGAAGQKTIRAEAKALTDELQHGKKNKDIEVLRALAVAGVLAHHVNGVLAPNFPPDAGGVLKHLNFGAGVDLFFAISGFVIARTLLPRLREAATTNTRYREVFAFWVRRMFRLWPTAWLWLAIILATTAVFKFENPQLAFDDNVDATIAGVLNFANFRFAEAFGSFSYGGSFHYWTLSLEEQFYFFLPFLALLSRRWLPLVLIALIALDVSRPVSLLSISTRSSALLLGVLIAIWSEHTSHGWLSAQFSKFNRNIALVVSMAVVASVALAAGALSPLAPFKYGVIAVLAGLAVLIASFDQDVLCPGRYWRSFSLWIGARSYALYVIHVPLYLVMHEVFGNFALWQTPLSPLVVWAAVGCSAILLATLAELNYRFVEGPFRRQGVRIAMRLARPANLAVNEQGR